MKVKGFNISAIPGELLPGLEEIMRAEGIESSKDGISLSAEKGSEMRVEVNGSNAKIIYNGKEQFFRAVSYLDDSVTSFLTSQTPLFDKNGVMLDCSRNAVIKPETVKFIIRKMALMGLNTLMLYTEDTYEVKSRPYFGYLRGRYTQAEIKELDDYADMFGIELVPCIQTLAHLERALHWPEIDPALRDTEDILMVGEEKVYEFIEDMIVAAAAPCRTKRIHIGMDEAWSLGLGNYRFKNGIVPSHKLMEAHLERVCKILDKHGLKPMMWSDMYIRSASKTGGYYDAPSVIPADVIASSREDVSLVYWDYYHNKTADYIKQIKLHKQFPSSTVFAGGLWTWVGPAPANDKAVKASTAALNACKAFGIKEVFATAWGDNGAEANALSVLPGLQLYAEFSYTHTHSMKNLATRFLQVTGENAELFMSLAKFNTVPGMVFESTNPVDTAKFLLYEDPLMPLFYEDTRGLELCAHYKSLAAKYARAKSESPLISAYYLFYKELAKALYNKCLWRERAAECVCGKAKGEAAVLSKQALIYAKQIKILKQVWRRLWDLTNKPFGFEVIDTRLGGLCGRYETAAALMKSFADGEIDDIETLSAEKLRFLTTNEGKFRGCYNWAAAISACKI